MENQVRPSHVIRQRKAESMGHRHSLLYVEPLSGACDLGRHAKRAGIAIVKRE